MRVDPANVTKLKHKFGVSQQMMWDTPMTRWAGEGNDKKQKIVRHPPLKEDVIAALMKLPRQSTAHPEKKLGGIPNKEPRGLAPMVLEPPVNGKGIELGNQGQQDGGRLDQQPRKTKNS